MIGLGFGVFFVGYTLLTYGWSQLRGCNASFISLAWPSPNGFQGCNPDPPPPANPATQEAHKPVGAAANGETAAAKAKGSTNHNLFVTKMAAQAYLGQLSQQYGTSAGLHVIKNSDGSYSVVTQ